MHRSNSGLQLCTPPPWRGSMRELRAARQQTTPPKVAEDRAAGAAALASPLARMTSAQAVELLSRGHWFLKRLGSAKHFKEQPRFVWLHVSGSGKSTRRRVCWDKRGKTKTGAPRAAQFVDLDSLKRVAWRSFSCTELDLIDKTGGDLSKGTLILRSVGYSAQQQANQNGAAGAGSNHHGAGNEAVASWADALCALGFRVRDRGPA